MSVQKVSRFQLTLSPSSSHRIALFNPVLHVLQYSVQSSVPLTSSNKTVELFSLYNQCLLVLFVLFLVSSFFLLVLIRPIPQSFYLEILFLSSIKNSWIRQMSCKTSRAAPQCFYLQPQPVHSRGITNKSGKIRRNDETSVSSSTHSEFLWISFIKFTIFVGIKKSFYNIPHHFAIRLSKALTKTMNARMIVTLETVQLLFLKCSFGLHVFFPVENVLALCPILSSTFTIIRSSEHLSSTDKALGGSFIVSTGLKILRS